MKIALVGYGKMGKAIERLAQERGHQILFRIGSGNHDLMSGPDFAAVDVVIEFTGPAVAQANVISCLRKGLPVVSGSTGWNSGLEAAQAVCRASNTAFLYSSNFSVGVQLFFLLNQKLAQLMASHPEYRLSVSETHHTEKKDAPSGTAVTLADGIAKENPAYRGWHLGGDEKDGSIPITAHREPGVPGTHTVCYDSVIDALQISHTAHSREGFALGAVLAAEFLGGKKGIFSMQDVLAEK